MLNYSVYYEIRITSKSFAQKFELKCSLDGPLSKLCVTPPFSINFRCQIENQVSDYRLLGASKFGQNPLKDVDSRVFTRMLRKEGRTDGSTEGRTDSSVTISLRNFVKLLPHYILVNTLESTSFNGF
jgi:hypothetical protein